MNCEHVEQLLPLYVGGDLDEEPSRLISAHVQCCPHCAGVADEYAGANQLLQQLAPPVFSDEVYASIRTRVLTEIERESDPPPWSNAAWRFFAPLAPLRMRMITAGLLLAMLGTAFYLFSNRSNQLPYNREVVDSTLKEEPNLRDSGAGGVPSENHNSGAPFSRPGRASHRVGHKTAEVARKKVVNAGPGMHRSRRLEQVDVAQRGMFTPSTSTTKLVALRKSDSIQPDVAVSPPSAPAPLRVEMQTGDPNIRIIWLSNQRPQSDVK